MMKVRCTWLSDYNDLHVHTKANGVFEAARDESKENLKITKEKLSAVSNELRLEFKELEAQV